MRVDHMHVSVIAAGLETAAQLAFLRAHRCDAMRGYWLGRATPASEWVRWIGERGEPDERASTAVQPGDEEIDAPRLH